MADEDNQVSYRDRFVAEEQRLDDLHDSQVRMRRIEGSVDPGLSSDFDPVIKWSVNAFLWSYLLGPSVYLGGELVSKIFKTVTKKLAPNHPFVATVMGLGGSVIGAYLGDPEFIASMVGKFGEEQTLAVAKEFIKDPEQLSLFEKIIKEPNDPESEAAIAKYQQLEKARISKIQSARQAEEAAAQARIPPEQGELPLKFPTLPIEEWVTNQFGERIGKQTIRDFFEAVKPEQEEIFPSEPDFTTYQGSSGKLEPEFEQLELFVHRTEQLLFEFPPNERAVDPELAKGFFKGMQQNLVDLGKKIFGTQGKKETLAKLARGDDDIRRGYGITAAMYDLALWVPGLPLAKVITDQAFLYTKAVFRTMGVAGEHGMPAAMRNAAKMAYAYRKAFVTAIKLGWRAGAEDSPIVQRILEADSDQVFGSEGYFPDSPTALAWRWLYYGRRGLSLGRRAILGVDQFSKYLAYTANEATGAYGMALDKAEELGLFGADKMDFAEKYADNLLRQVGTPERDALTGYAKQKMFEQTFTEQSRLVKSTNDWLNKNNWDAPYLGPIGARNLVAFLPTPAALIREGVNLTPAGALNPNTIAKFFGSSKIDQKAMMAQWAVATMLWHYLGHLTHTGRLVGDGPKGPHRDVWPDKNHANSMRFGKHWFGFNHLGPYGFMLSLAADSHAMYHQTDDPYAQDGIINGIGDALMSKAEEEPFFETVANIIHAVDAYNEAVENGQEGAGAKAVQEFFGRAITEYLPKPVRDAREWHDPTITKAKTAIDIVKQNLPWWSDSVPASRDRFGYLQYPPVGSGPANSATKMDRLLNSENPIPVRGDTDTDEVDQELFRYGVRFTPIPDHVVRGSGPSAINIPISPQQQDDWARNQGHGLLINGLNQHDAMMKKIQSDEWQKIGPAGRKAALEHIATHYRSRAEHDIERQFDPSIMQQARALRHKATHGPELMSAPGQKTEPGAPITPGSTITMPITVKRSDVGGPPPVNLPTDTGEPPLK